MNHKYIFKVKEIDIQHGIINYLQALENRGDLYFFRSGSGAVPTARGSFFKTGKPGCPDISIVTNTGQYIGVEVKTPIGRMSPDQKITQNKLSRLGATYIIARSVTELENDLKSLGVIPD